MPEGDLNIKEDAAQSIINNCLLHKVDVTFSCDRQSDIVLDEDWVDLPPLGIPTINELESDDESDTSMPELESRSGDTMSSGDSDDDSWDRESIDSIEEEEK